jgi:ribonuclease VapC
LVGHSAYRIYGHGSGHRARLNFGDCFAYALAKSTGEPLLFKGDDFIHTDIEPARIAEA